MIGALMLGAPWWLWGLAAAVGVPLAAHLLSRRAVRSAVFPTVRFLRQAIDAGRRRVRLQDRLLLALRMLALALIVLAFARPLWLPRALGAQHQGVDAVLLLDRSASMSRIEHGASLFDAAKADVIRAIESLDPATDRAIVILIDARPSALAPRFTAGMTHLVDLVRAVAPTEERGDLEGALALVPGLRGADAGEQRRALIVELHSDDQGTQWPWGAGEAPPMVRQVGAAWRVRQVGRAAPNMAIRNPTVTPSRPVLGQVLTLSAEVANFSERPAKTAVTMTVDKADQTVAVSVPARGLSMVTFRYTPGRVGLTLLALHLDDQSEALELDNQTGVFINVALARQVAIVTRRDIAESEAFTPAAYFVDRALAPDADGAGGAGGYGGVQLHRWTPSDLAANLRPLTGADGVAFVVIVEAGALDDAALTALRDYLLSGGAVLWVVDSPAAAAALHRFTATGAAGGNDIGPVRLPPGAEFLWREVLGLTIGQGRFDDPILSVFEGPSRGLLLRQRFEAVPTCSLAPGAEALLTLDDGSPLLAAQWVGYGRLAVLGAAIDPAHSQFVSEPIFVPLIHQLMRELTPGPPMRANPHPGFPASLAVDGSLQAGELRLTGPAGEAAPFSTQPDGRRTVVQFERLDHVGPYRVLRADTGALVGGLYVDLDPAESDFARAPESPADSGRAGSSSNGEGLASGPSGGGGALHPEPVELWPWAIALALLLVAAEQAVLWLLPSGDEAEDRQPLGILGRA